MRDKPDLLVLDIGGCEGCPLTILRIYPELSSIVNLYSRYVDKEIDLSKSYDVAIVTGAVCVNEPEIINKVRIVRSRSKILIAYGSCASVGGITLFSRGGQEPKPHHRTYQPLSAIVDVDYSIPGCPPAPTLLLTLVKSLIEGKGFMLSVFASASKVRRLSGFDLLDEVVLTGLCIGCGACVLSCPTNALQLVEGRPDLIVEKCIRCGTCCIRCPRFTQILIHKYPARPKTLQEVVSQ